MNPYEVKIKNLYLGILSNFPDFAGEEAARLEYDLAVPEWEELRSQYPLEAVARTGTSFEKAKRLLHYFAPKLAHSSFYDNHVTCNALRLLEYSFQNGEHGINCLNKAKILAEGCLSLGIYARRVFLYPFSPYDFDSHVVCEIYDERLRKWIMLDPTTDGYFGDETHTPLSMYEIRTSFAQGRFLTFVASNGRKTDLPRAAIRNEGINLYFMKNCFRLAFEPYNGFGEREGSVCLIPEGYSVCRNETLNHQFRVDNMPPEFRHLLEAQEAYLRKTNHEREPVAYSVQSLYASPLEGR